MERLLAIVAVRDEMRFLPGWLRNVAPQVDGIVALDDGSADGSSELLASHESVIEMLQGARDRPAWDEVHNHKRLVRAAVDHGAYWILALDADERLEREFRTRARRALGERPEALAFALPLRELWDAEDSYRTDGIWGRKRVARLFRAMADHQHDERPLHGIKAPLQGRAGGEFPHADALIYHLRMVRPEDRGARRARYEALDPGGAHQRPPIGYAYLTDPEGLTLERVDPARRYDH